MNFNFLKIVFIDKKENLEPYNFLIDNVYDELQVIYKHIKNDYEVVQIIEGFRKAELEPIIVENILYVMGLTEKLKKDLEEKLEELHKLVPYLGEEILPSTHKKIDNTQDTEDTEKDIIDKLAEKYRKEAEDKGKLN